MCRLNISNVDLVRNYYWPLSELDRRTNGNCRRPCSRLRQSTSLIFLAFPYLLTGCQFIEVWRQKETALQTNRLTNLLLSNASHQGQFKPALPRLKSDHTPRSTHTFKPYYQVRGWLVQKQRNDRPLLSYLEMALNGPLDHETRDNLSKSHSASKVANSQNEFTTHFLILITELIIFYK